MPRTKTLHGIDMTAPDAVAQLLDFHRRTFGSATMQAEGDGGDGGQEAPGGGEQTPGTPEPPQAPGAPQAPQDREDAARREAEETARQEKAQAEQEKAVREAVERAEKETRDKLIAQLTGQKAGEQTPDPEELARQLEQQRADAETARAELTVFRAAAQHGADPNRLLDSRAFMQELGKIDTADADAVGKLIKTTVEKNEHLRAAAPNARRSGPEHTGGTSSASQPLDLGTAIAGAYGTR